MQPVKIITDYRHRQRIPNDLKFSFFFLIFRYIDIVHSFWHMTYVSKKGVYIIIGIGWIFSALLNGGGAVSFSTVS